MRTEAVKALIRKADADWTVVENLLSEGKLTELKYGGSIYYMRGLSSRIRTRA
jgi:hypothetical protein